MAILAVAMGATVATALLTVSLNIREKVSRELRTYGANLLIIPMEDLSLLEWEGVDFKKEAESRGGFQTRPYIQESDLIRLKKTFWRNNILGFSPLLEADVQVKGRRRTLVGTWFDREMEIEGERVQVGMKWLRPWWEVRGRWVSGEGECMVGARLARREGIEIGDEVEIEVGSIHESQPLEKERDELTLQKLMVVGIISTGGPEENRIFTDLHFVQNLVHQPGGVGKVEVSALLFPEDELARKDPEKMTQEEYEKWSCRPYLLNIARDLEDVIPRSRAIPIRQIVQSEGVILSKIKFLFLFVTLIALTAGTLGVMATMTASVLERRKEIGYLKALGAGNGAISALFLGEAGIIGLSGGVIGYLIGILFAYWIGVWVFQSMISPRVVVLILVLLLSVGISFLATLLPLRKATGILPASVLKGG